MTIVGSSVVVGKVVAAHWPIFLFMALRYGIATVLLAGVLLALPRGLPRPGARDLGLIAVQSLAGNVMFNVLLLHGLRLTSAAEGGIVTSTTPAVAAVLSVALLGERLTRRGLAGIGLAVLGLLAINALGPAVAGRGPDPLLGNVLVLGAVVGEATYVVCGKVASRSLGPTVITAAMCAFGFLMFLPPALLEARTFDWGRPGVADWLSLAYYAVAVTVVAILLWSRGLLHVPASTAAVFTGMMPVSAVGLSYLLLGEPFLWSHVAGGACVLGGILLVARQR